MDALIETRNNTTKKEIRDAQWERKRRVEAKQAADRRVKRQLADAMEDLDGVRALRIRL